MNATANIHKAWEQILLITKQLQYALKKAVSLHIYAWISVLFVANYIDSLQKDLPLTFLARMHETLD